ncbi:MAG: hypothetical protein AAF741_00055 [Bacteroidota bacterium]
MRFTAFICLLLSACASANRPPMHWPNAEEVIEISGLAFVDSCALGHNDSGDEANVYLISSAEFRRNSADEIETINLSAAARDWEDMTTDPVGNWYLGDFGDNFRRRDSLQIYRYHPEIQQTDLIEYTYPDGRRHDCEAMVFQGGKLHVFTKARPGIRKQYWSFHYSIPAEPGSYEARLVDSLYIPRRAVTAADIDSLSGELILTAYNYKRILGFFPAAASSVITISNYPEGRFYRGEVKRKNLSWATPNQVEGVAFYDDCYFYVAREKTGPWRARIRRKKR